MLFCLKLKRKTFAGAREMIPGMGHDSTPCSNRQTLLFRKSVLFSIGGVLLKKNILQTWRSKSQNSQPAMAFEVACQRTTGAG